MVFFVFFNTTPPSSFPLLGSKVDVEIVCLCEVDGRLRARGHQLQDAGATRRLLRREKMIFLVEVWAEKGKI